MTAEGIKKVVKDISLKDFTDDECLVLFILSHGTNQHPKNKNESNGVYVLGYDGNYVNLYEDIVARLQSISNLTGKPKLIFGDVRTTSFDIC